MSLAKLKNEVKKLMKNDPAHDFEHIMRVYKNAQMICKNEKNANQKLVLTSVLLHDLVSLPKSNNLSKNSSVKSAQFAKKILKEYNYTNTEIQIVANAIRDHSYSRKITPTSLEGKILQDADRLDAIGAIGIARVFSVGGFEKRPLYNRTDPFCTKRTPNDQRWTLDHFFQKLLKLEKLMNTKSAKIEAKRRTNILKNYLKELEEELYP